MSDISDYLIRVAAEINGKSQAPIDVVGLAKSFGISFIRSQSENVRSPSIEVSEDRCSIIVPTENWSRSHFQMPRFRFRIAHELGHYLIWEKFGIIPKCNTEYWRVERFCDGFAGELLIPKDSVKARCAKGKISWQKLPETIATQFNSSVSVAANRITELFPHVIYVTLSADTAGIRVADISTWRTPLCRVGIGARVRASHMKSRVLRLLSGSSAWRTLDDKLEFGNLRAEGGEISIIRKGPERFRICLRGSSLARVKSVSAHS